MQTGGGQEQTSSCTEALCATYCMTVTRVRFKVLSSVVCHHVRQTWSFSFNGHAHNTLTPMNQNSICTWGTTLRLTPRNMQFPRKSHPALSMPSFTNHNLAWFLSHLTRPTHVVKPAGNTWGVGGREGEEAAKAKHICQNQALKYHLQLTQFC